MPFNKKHLFKWILFPCLVLVPIITSVFVVVSCSSNTYIPSPPPVEPSPPPVEPSPPPVEPSPPPVEPSPPLDEDVKNLKREDLYTIKRSKTKNNQLVGVVGLDLTKILTNVHVVDDAVSNLPSYFANQTNKIINLLNVKRSDFNISFTVIDYDDSLKYSNDHRIYFPEFEKGYVSPLKHTVITGRGLYSLANTTEDYQKIGGFSSGLNFSWLDFQINLVYQKNPTIQYQFQETIIFREGIAEQIYGRRQGTHPGESRFIIEATGEQKSITGWNQNNDFSNIEPNVYNALVNTNTNPSSFIPSTLSAFIAIKHFKPLWKISDADEGRTISDEKTINDLPPTLTYAPYLSLISGNDDPDFVSRLISIESKKNQGVDMVKILVNNENIQSQLNQSSIRWHNFGKPGNIDYYYRGHLNAAGGSFATVFNLWYRFT